jgi:hypothetical protein
MGATTKTAFVTAFAIAVILHLLFGGSRMAGAILNGGLMENTAIGGMSWMWIPALLTLGLGVLLLWVTLGKRSNVRENRANTE